MPSPEFWITNPHRYTTVENSEFIVWCSGIVTVADNTGALLDTLEVGRRVYEKHADFNRINGWFMMVVYSKADSAWLFFGDNCGSQYFFVDWENGLFCDSLLSLRARRGNKAKIDIAAAVQIFDHGRCFGEKTIVEGISKSDPHYTYLLKNGTVERYSKELLSFSDIPEKITLSEVIGPLLKAAGQQKICAVCTGGTDSRTVLACLTHMGARPDLVITGHEDNPDIGVAKKIADKLGLDLTVISPDNKRENWLESAFIAFDGAYDVVLSYRHLQKRDWAQRNGYTLEFGGVAGEFYKNAFCHPFRWGTFNSDRKEFFQTHLLRGNGSSAPWCGETLRRASSNRLAEFNSVLDLGLKEHSYLQKCNGLGFNMLSCGAGAITNSYGAMCCKVDPLMDRRLVATASKANPVFLSMHMWQRKQIAAYAPSLSDIETDQGYSCSLNPVRLLLENCKRAAFYGGRMKARLDRRLKRANGARSVGSADYWNSDYTQARATKLWTDAVDYCTTAGIVRDGIDPNQIPLEQTGWILLIGMMFGETFHHLYLPEIDKGGN